jgi:hypothetical protein
MGPQLSPSYSCLTVSDILVQFKPVQSIISIKTSCWEKEAKHKIRAVMIPHLQDILEQAQVRYGGRG